MGRVRGWGLLVVDANVLIDFAKADVSALGLVVRHLGPVYVPGDVPDEVRQLDDDGCTRLGLATVDGTLEQPAETGAMRGGLSFAHRVCLTRGRARWPAHGVRSGTSFRAARPPRHAVRTAAVLRARAVALGPLRGRPFRPPPARLPRTPHRGQILAVWFALVQSCAS